MEQIELQKLVEHLSLKHFGRPFLHQATFNPRLRTTGGRYLLHSHHIELNQKHYEVFGLRELEGIIKHELCHYHLHLQKKGYKHQDKDFKELLEKVGGARYCQVLPHKKRSSSKKYEIKCMKCNQLYIRKRKMDINRYACGKCGGKLRMTEGY